MIPDAIERETTIAAPPARVWELITSAEHLGTWFGDAGADIDLRPGGELALRWEKYGTVHGRVEAVEPPRRFAFRWSIIGRGDGIGFREENATLVEFTLAETAAGGTTLRVIESGFTSLATNDEERLQRHGENTQGWAAELDELRRHAEQVAA
jgi:uncharacterized protein YndB with AHSA1/START domain